MKRELIAVGETMNLTDDQINNIEERAIQLGFRFCGAWIASFDDERRGHQYNYHPACSEGDLIVRICGFDKGSVEFEENWGDPQRYA